MLWLDLQVIFIWWVLRFASLHEDVNIVARLGEVDEVDDMGVLDFLANDDFWLDALDDVHFELLFGSIVSLFLGYLCSERSTCLSSYCLEMILQAREVDVWPLGQAP